MYNQRVMEIFKNPQNLGEIRSANGIGLAVNSSGDVIRAYLVVEDGVITDIKFKTFGGVALIAASSVATEILKGMNIQDALNFDTQLILKELGELPQQKLYVLNLISEVIVDAIDNYNKRLEKEEERKRKEVVA